MLSEPPRPTSGWVDIAGTRTSFAAGFTIHVWPAPNESGNSTVMMHYPIVAARPDEPSQAIRITMWSVYVAQFTGFDFPHRVDFPHDFDVPDNHDDEGTPSSAFGLGVTDTSKLRSKYLEHPHTRSSFNPMGSNPRAWSRLNLLRHYNIGVNNLGSWDLLAERCSLQPFELPAGRPSTSSEIAYSRFVEDVANDVLGPVTDYPPDPS